MTKASLSLLIVLFAALLASADTFAQRGSRTLEPRFERPDLEEENIFERVQQTLRMGQRVRLADILRMGGMQLELISLSITAQSFQGPADLEIGSRFSVSERIKVRRELREISVPVINLGHFSELELIASAEISIESISAVVRRPPAPSPREQQVSPHSLIRLRINQEFRGVSEIPLKKLVKEQLRLSLEGAEIERVAIEANPIGHFSASVQLEINNRPVGPLKYLSGTQRRTPLQVHTREEIKSLRLNLNGHLMVHEIVIRIGNVRLVQPHPGRSLHLRVNQEIDEIRSLDLSLYSPESMVIDSLNLEGNVRSGVSEVTVMNRMGQTIGRGIMSHGRTVIYLTSPTNVRDLRIFASNSIHILSVEAEAFHPQRF